MKTATTPITVAIVEDDARIRQALTKIFTRTADCCCTGQYGSGEEAVPALVKQPPRVIIMDINLPGMDGVECVRQLAAQGVTSQILMLTVHKDTNAIFAALSAGASGYLVKPVHAEQLLEAVRDIYGGGAPMTSSIARKVVQVFQHPPAATDAVLSEGETEVLSEREMEVLERLSKGHAYKEIAEHMQISYCTVHTYIRRIYKKLHVNSRGQAVARLQKR